MNYELRLWITFIDGTEKKIENKYPIDAVAFMDFANDNPIKSIHIAVIPD